MISDLKVYPQRKKIFWKRIQLCGILRGLGSMIIQHAWSGSVGGWCEVLASIFDRFLHAFSFALLITTFHEQYFLYLYTHLCKLFRPNDFFYTTSFDQFTLNCCWMHMSLAVKTKKISTKNSKITSSSKSKKTFNNARSFCYFVTFWKVYFCLVVDRK